MVCKKKIALFVPLLNSGGAERNIVYLANSLSKNDFIVDLVLIKNGGDYINMVSKDVNVISVGFRKSNKIFFSLINILNYLKYHKPDVVISTLPHVNVFWCLLKRFSFFDFKLILREANTPSVEILKSWKERLIFKLSKMTYNNADYIVGVSKGVTTDVRNIYNIQSKKITTIYNGLNIDKIISESYIIDENIKFSFDKTKKYLLFVGRLDIQKDLSTLLESFSLLENESLNLIILGDGPLNCQLQDLAFELGIDKKCHFLGFVDNPFFFMRMADIFILPSLYEGLPGALLQVMCFNTHIISTDCPSGPREILNNGKFGSLISLSSPIEMKFEILKCLEGKDINMRKRLLFIKENFSQESCKNKYIKLINDENIF